MRWIFLGWVILVGNLCDAAEMSFQFTTAQKGEQPGGFTSMLAGEGRPGQWEITTTEVAPALEPLSPQAPRTAIKAVLTQRDHDPTDERFPMLVYDGLEVGDFTMTTRLRVLGGEKEQMAGVVFRAQDQENFYVVRVSALGKNLRFYKVVSGMRGQIIGPSLPIRTNVWHELKIQCEGNQIVIELDGQLVMPPLQDISFSRGKIGFWTKSDSICQFDGAHLEYVPVVPLSERVVAAALEKYSRVLDLRLYTPATEGDATTVVACKNPEDLGKSGGDAERGALRDGNIYYGKSKKEKTVTVVMPLRDRNGDPVAAARIVMDSFAGQTQDNALVRARPIVRLMEGQVAISREEFR